jgi:hypothetical protein
MDNRHVIEQAVFDIRFGSEEQAFAQQGDMGAYIRDGLLPVIDEVFTELSEPGLVFRFDRLEIDLGVVDYDSHRDEWKRRLREQLQSALAAGLVPVERVKGEALQGVITRRQSELQRLRFFLERGYMPWHAEQPDSLTLEALMLRVLRNDSDRLLEFIRNADDKEMVLNRIVNQFSATVVTGLARMIRAFPGDLPAKLLQIMEKRIPVEENPAPNDVGGATQMTQLRRRIADALLAGDATGIRAEWPGLCRDYPHLLLHEVRSHGRRASVRRKIADGFPETMLKEIVLLLEPGEASFIEEVTEKPELFRQASSRLQEDGDVTKRRLWEFTLGYLLEERGSLFNRKSYLGSMVRQMAAYGVIDIRELLASMHQVLVNLEVATPLKSELLEIIDTLAVEMGLELPVDGEDRSKTVEQARMKDLQQRIDRALQHGTPEELAEVWPRLLRDYPQLLLRELRRLGHDETVRRGIAKGFSETMLREIVLLLEPGEASFIEEVTEKPELFCQPSSRLQEGGYVIKRRLWEFTLGYLLEERGSLFNRKSYLGSMARQMAAYGTIDIRELLASMHQILVNLEVATPLKSELLEVINTLAEETALELPISVEDRPGSVEQAWMNDLQQRIDWALQHGIPEELAEVWPRLLRDYPHLLLRELRRLGRVEGVRRKIADGFPETMLKEIVVLLEPVSSGFIEQVVGSRELFSQTGAFTREGGDGGGKRLWEFTLGYQLEERGSRFNKKTYMASLIRQMAAHNNLDNLTLLKSICRGLVESASTNPLFGELLELVNELVEEGAPQVAEERKQPESTPHCGNALAEQLRRWLILGDLPAREGTVTRLLDELAAHHPGQLLLLFNELRGGDPFRLAVNGSHGAEELRRMIELFLLLAHRADQEKRTNFLGAIDDWAIRSGDAGRFLGQVFELLLHDRPIDCEALMKEQLRESGESTVVQAPVDASSLAIADETELELQRYLHADRPLSAEEKGRLVRIVELLSSQRPERLRQLLQNSALGERRLDFLMEQLPQQSTQVAAVATPLVWRLDDAVEEISEEIYVANAGLVLATPYLPRLFTMLDLMDTWLFIDVHAAERGVHLLHYLAERGADPVEPLLVLNKILCGLAPETPVVRQLTLDDREKELVDGMIAGMIANWPVIGATSVDSFRESFLQREGVLRLKDDGWHLLVEPRAYDLLLDQLPWSFSIIKHPWMAQALHVEWRHGL